MNKPLRWNRTKIVATLGPSTSSYSSINELIKAGIDVVRLNLSHGTKETHSQLIKMVRCISQRLKLPVAILADLPGPKLRVELSKSPRRLIKGEEVVLTTKSPSDDRDIFVRYKNLPAEVKEGDVIFLDDGAIRLRVKQSHKEWVRCKVSIGGILRTEAGLNLPGVTLKTDFLTSADKEWIRFVINEGVDILALSFVRKAQDIRIVRGILERAKKDKDIFIISKIEKYEALREIDKIIQESDGIMVARGDLGVELSVEKVALIQKSIIQKCNKVGRPVITATQMLESMITNPRPTRAEVTDITNAILDGTDAVMLSGETAIGRYPLQAVKTIVKIARYVEASLDYDHILYLRHRELTGLVADIMSFSACESALRVKAKVIVTPTHTGHTARMVSRYRPKAMIVAITPFSKVQKQLCLCWGVYPVIAKESNSLEGLISDICNILKERLGFRIGERFVVTGGGFLGKGKGTNFVRVESIQ